MEDAEYKQRKNKDSFALKHYVMQNKRKDS